jgi:penicillin-binding protein 1C
MEQQKDKLWIISQYLNRAPFGANFIGIEAAANGWFGKSAKTLTLSEAALLAGMVQAPSRFRPDRCYDRALKRRRYVLGRMVELGLATEEQAEIAGGLVPELRRAPRPFKYPHYCDYYISRFCNGNSGGSVSRDITTPLIPSVQEFAQRCVDETSSKKGCDVSAIVRKVSTGEVVAMAVSGDYFEAESGQVNTALAPRSAGSTLKTFLAAFAIDMGLVAPGEKLLDIPKTYKGYTPSNFDARWRGAVSLDDSLVLSLNMPFIRLLEKMRVDRFGALLRTAGFEHVGYADSKNGLGMAIGNVSVSLDELTFAYARLARAASGDAEPPFSAEGAYLVTEMLSTPARSMAALGHLADVNAPRFAWKTGTSSAYCDAWTVAWNPEYVVGVWCGHISGRFGDKSVTGAEIAAPLAWEIVRFIEPGINPKWFAKPNGISTRMVCSVSGLPANHDCPSSVEAPYSKFTSSARLCDVHRRDFEGKVVERLDPLLEAFYNRVEAALKLEILQPADGAEFEFVEGMGQQRIVVKVAGNPPTSTLWWFLNGKPVGQTIGRDSLVLEMKPGKYSLFCVTAEGVSAEVKYQVLSSK